MPAETRAPPVGAPLIRRAGPDDLAAVRAIVREAYAKYVSRIGREPGPMRSDYAALLARGAIHVAERDGVVLGLVVLLAEPDAMLLDNVAVAPEAQGSGLGRMLLDFAEGEARRRGRECIRLYTHATMTENIALYQARGYAETHRATEDGLLRVFMAKRLD